MSELYAVLMPRLYLAVTEMPIWIIAMIWVMFLVVLCVRLSVATDHPLQWIARSLLVAIVLTVLLALGSSVYAFLLFPAVYWGCGWCWCWCW